MLLSAAHETDVGRPTPAGGGECPIPSNAGPPTIPWNLRVIVLQGECCRPRRPTLCRAGAPRTPWRTAGPVRGADPSAGEGLPGSDDLVGDKLAVRLSCGTVGISPFGKGPNPQLDEDGWFVAVHPAPALEDVCPVLFYAHSGARRLKVPECRIDGLRRQVPRPRDEERLQRLVRGPERGRPHVPERPLAGARRVRGWAVEHETRGGTFRVSARGRVDRRCLCSCSSCCVMALWATEPTLWRRLLSPPGPAW